MKVPIRFPPFSNSVSDESVVRINSVTDFTSAASFNLDVQRLASKDIALTQTLAADGTDLAATGTGDITITIGDVTETFSLDTTGKTNSEVLQELSESINTTFGEQAGASLF